MTTPQTPEPSESVAVIGMRGRFPGARTLDELWLNLRAGVESISTFTPGELRAAGVDPDVVLKVPGYVPAGAVLEDVSMFDAHFFGFSARDAELMDPQQRLLLECGYEALEDAGYDSERYPGLVGVFAGSDWSTYLYAIYANLERLGFVDGMALAVGNDKDHLTTHLSYKLDLRGPSVAVQTACSTSLVAVCMAVHNLLTYQCDMALAGGVAVSVPQRKGYLYQPGGIVSPDGHCRAFDEKAQGTVIGSGVGLVVLKRLSEAVADGDHIYAVIRGAAINNDGSAKVGYTAPSVEGQATVIAMAHAAAGVDPATIDYVEAHGTGTALGDPIEVAALTQAFAARTDRKNFCAIGTLKSNVGHMSSAAGVGGLIKTVLSLHHGELPPTLHFTRPNPQIDFANSPFYVNARLAEWPRNGHRRRAAVSSFGIGGTNAHVVLEEAPEREPSGPGRPRQLLVLSARSAPALERATDDVAARLEADPALPLDDVAYTLQVGRRAFGHRRTVLCAGDTAVAAEALRARDPSVTRTAAPEARTRSVAYLFPGQGTQYVGMARELHDTEPTFRAVLDACCELLVPELGLDLRDLLFAPPEHAAAAAAELRRTALTQPALFAVEYALAAVWAEWGVYPYAMLGHSIGEWVAACVAGVFPLERALALVAERGRLMDAMPTGAMLAVPVAEAELRPLLGGGLALAAVNAPGLSVLSGPEPAIAAAEARLAALGVYGRRLHTSHAFHSAMMEPAVAPFVEAVRAAAPAAPTVPFLSNVTGTWITAEQATDPAYWGRQLREPVRFGAGVAELLQAGDWVMIEVGPGQALGALARQQPRAAEQLFVASLPGAQEPAASSVATLLDALGRVWLAGVGVDWASVHVHEARRRVPLPTYPFEREHYWIGDTEQPAGAAASDAPAAGARGAGAPGSRDVGQWFYTPTWKPAPPRDAARDAATEPESWLVFGDGGALEREVVARLRDAGHAATVVVIGDRPGRVDPGTIAVRPRERADYDLLAQALRADGVLPRRVLHLWGALPDAGDAEAPDAFDRAQYLGYHSLVFLAQALERQRVTHPMEVGVVCAGTQAVLGDETLLPERATVLGACKVVPQELSNLTVRAVDLALDEVAGAGVARLAERLVRELTAEPFAAVVAYRKGRRWVQSYERTPVEAPAGVPPRLRERGVYLITGGLGNIGLALAGRLADAVRARLVLTGRSALPERGAWDSYLASRPDDEVSRKLRALLDLEARGAEVLVVRADAGDEAQMREAVARAKARFGALHGIVHGAGNVAADGFAPVSGATERVAAVQFAPKAAGLTVVDRVTRDEPLDFVLLLSSLSAVLGGLGLVAYASANAFLDAYAARRNQDERVPWLGVNWDAWHFPWQGPAPAQLDSMTPEEGAEAFLRVLDRAPRQVVVAVGDLHARLAKWVELASVRDARHAAASNGHGAAAGGGGALHPRPNLSTQFAAPRTPTERTIAGVWEQLLGVGPVGVHDKFFELGGHSLLAIQVVSRLRDAFGVEVPVQRMFEAPTVTQLAAAVDEDVAARAQAEPAGEAERVEDVMRMVESLSDEEVARLLAEQGAAD